MRRLVIRPGAIGDFVVSLPAVECLKTEYLEVWTHRRTAPLVRFADRVQAIDATGLELTGITQGPPAVLAEFDEIVSWYGSNRAEFREAVRHLPFRFLSALPPEGCAMHATDFYLQQTGCEPGAIPRIDTGLPREDYAVIHPFSGSARKNWPLDKFRALAARLERSMPVAWCSGAEDPPLGGALRIDDLWELACWLSRAKLYIGNDSGITHLAAAVGTPVLAIFGPTDPAVWAPRGAHVRVVKVKMES
jgi:ADP-heptose:LPS heptosyltransferase